MKGCNKNSHRNLRKKQDKTMWDEQQKEELPFRYRLHYPDGTSKNLRCGRLGLAAEIRETKPIQIERIA